MPGGRRPPSQRRRSAPESPAERQFSANGGSNGRLGTRGAATGAARRVRALGQAVVRRERAWEAANGAEGPNRGLARRALRTVTANAGAASISGAPASVATSAPTTAALAASVSRADARTATEARRPTVAARLTRDARKDAAPGRATTAAEPDIRAAMLRARSEQRVRISLQRLAHRWVGGTSLGSCGLLHIAARSAAPGVTPGARGAAAPASPAAPPPPPRAAA